MTAIRDLMRQEERAIVERIVDTALTRGYSVSVCDAFDGDGEVVVKRSQDRAQILGAMFTTEGDLLNFFADGKRLGCISFIYGNGEDVTHDWSDDPRIDSLIPRDEA